MDNLACRKASAIERLVHSAGAQVRHLSAYSPGLNPIEKWKHEPLTH